MPKQTIINASKLYDGNTLLENKAIVIEGNQIVDIRDKQEKADFEGIVTPAFIDGHSHIGMDREGEPYNEGETNDYTSQFLISNDPIDSIYFDDRAFKDAVDFGNLYSCVVPGSGNLVGGKAKVIRNFTSTRKDAEILDYGYKMALGYNPRSTTSWKGNRPNTRMGVYGMLEKKLDEILLKKQRADHEKNKAIRALEIKREKAEISKEEFEQMIEDINLDHQYKFSTEENDYIKLLSGEKVAKIHVHKEDDVEYLIKLKEKYGLKVTADHTSDVWHKSVFNNLAKAGIPIMYGPLASLGSKVELKHSYYENVKLLMESNAEYALISDHPVILSTSLRDTLKYFMIQGMSDVDAISLITRNPARILGIDDYLGTIEKGKWASLVIWDKDPLHLASFPKVVIAEGKIIRKGK